MRKIFALWIVASCLIPAALAQQAPPSPYEEAAAKLQSLTDVPLTGCRWHKDVARPEDPALDDSSWESIEVGKKFETGVQVFRCWYTVPEKVQGYDIRGSKLKVLFEMQGDGVNSVMIFANGHNLFRGDCDLLEPVLITSNAQPGERILVSVRLEINEQPRKMTRSEILFDPPSTRLDPGLLQMEIRSLEPILKSFPDTQRDATFSSSVKAIDFSALQKADQAAFDASLRSAQQQLETLQPWVRQFRVRAVGNAHIDMAWLWPWTEAVEVVRNTWRSSLNFMNEYPDFTFAASTARAYEWMEEKYPALYHEIELRVKDGRWEIVGGMWVEPDLNMPGGESLTRQILIGKQYFKKKFGVDVKIGWNPDSFGYNWQLPQIYKKSGIDYFVTQKLLWAHEYTTFPYKLFYWQSPDGSKLLTYFPHDYGSLMEPVSMAGDVAEWVPSLYGKQPKDPEIMYLYGVGDHGGGPTRTMLEQAMQLQRPNVVYPTVEFSTPTAFFSSIENRKPALQIPSWNGELYFQYHRGVFTTQAETKKLVRKTEEDLLNAEKFAAFANLYRRDYPQADFTSVWKGLLFDQFHDIMPGSGIAVNYLDARRNLNEVRRATAEIANRSLAEIAAQVNTSAAGTPLIVFNPMAWERKEIIEAEVQLAEAANGVVIADAAGHAVPAQLLSNDAATHRVRFLFETTAPSLGYAAYFVRAGKAANATSNLRASADSLENEFLRLTLDHKSGCVTSLIDKRSNLETLAPANTDTGGPKDKICANLLQAFVDTPKEYDAWNIDASFEDKFWNLDTADEVTLAEFGPLRAVIRVKHHFQNSTFVQDLTLYADSPRVDVHFQADWNEKHILLKATFPVAAQADKATYEIPFGTIQRPTTRNTLEEKSQFEVPAQHWADISDSKRGLSVLNDCKYGYDAKGNVLRISLLRSPSWPDAHADEGHHEFVYSLYPHAATWREAQTIRQGYDLNYPLLSMQVQNHSGNLPPTNSFVTLDANNVVLTAAKWAEDGSGMIVRFYEWAGKESDVILQIPPGASAAEETNLIEQSAGNLSVSNDHVSVHTKPFEIKTIKVRFANP